MCIAGLINDPLQYELHPGRVPDSKPFFFVGKTLLVYECDLFVTIISVYFKVTFTKTNMTMEKKTHHFLYRRYIFIHHWCLFILFFSIVTLVFRRCSPSLILKQTWRFNAENLSTFTSVFLRALQDASYHHLTWQHARTLYSGKVWYHSHCQWYSETLGVARLVDLVGIASKTSETCLILLLCVVHFSPFDLSETFVVPRVLAQSLSRELDFLVLAGQRAELQGDRTSSEDSPKPPNTRFLPGCHDQSRWFATSSPHELTSNPLSSPRDFLWNLPLFEVFSGCREANSNGGGLRNLHWCRSTCLVVFFWWSFHHRTCLRQVVGCSSVVSLLWLLLEYKPPILPQIPAEVLSLLSKLKWHPNCSWASVPWLSSQTRRGW